MSKFVEIKEPFGSFQTVYKVRGIAPDFSMSKG